MTSIRRFMVIVLLAAITLINFLAALHGYRSSMEKAEILFDQQLADVASLLIESKLEAKDNPQTPLENRSHDGIIYQIWDQQRHSLYRSNHTATQLITPLVEGLSYSSVNAYRYRVLVKHETNSSLWYIVAERNDQRYTMAEEVVLSSVLPIVGGLPIIGLLIWLIIGRGLSPLKQLACLLQSKKSHDLSALPNDDNPLELTQLVNSTNDLLSRLSQSFEREKRFSGDAAHELRTPLSVLKVQLYNLAKQLPANDNNIVLLNSSINRMSHIIEQMLMLYRTTPEQSTRSFVAVNFHHLVQEVLIEQYPHLEAKHQNIELLGNAGELDADRFALTIMLKNLIDNANKYTPEGGDIKVSLTDDEGQIVLCVEDSGCGIAEHLHERVFERFYRVNGDQHKSNSEGCGLGFSIIQHIIELHAGQIALSHSSFAQGLKVTVTLPKKENRYV